MKIIKLIIGLILVLIPTIYIVISTVDSIGLANFIVSLLISVIMTTIILIGIYLIQDSIGGNR